MRFLFSLLLLFSAVPGLADIEPFTAHYEVSISGLSGEAVTTLSRTDAGTYVLENRSRALGMLGWLARPRDMVERSEFVLDERGLRPISFLSEDGTRRNKRGSAIEFDWSAGNATAVYEGDTRSFELETGMLDRQLLQIAMMADLADGVTEAQYTIIDRHDQKVYEIAVLGEETVEVPAGTYDTVLIERKRPGSSRSSLMWCAPSLGYLTVKMQQFKGDKTIGTLQLTETG